MEENLKTRFDFLFYKVRQINAFISQKIAVIHLLFYGIFIHCLKGPRKSLSVLCDQLDDMLTGRRLASNVHAVEFSVNFYICFSKIFFFLNDIMN